MSKIIHGQSRRLYGNIRIDAPELRAYVAMKTRCTNANSARFRDYGGRGIKICERWLLGENGQTGFQCFLADMGPRPSPSHTVDRRNNERDYCPDNCRWATRIEQARNARNNRLVDIGLGEMTFAEAVERSASGVSRNAAAMRVHRGWRDDDAILTPIGQRPSQQEAPF